MNLSTYISAERGRGATIAKEIGHSPAYVSQLASGVRCVSPELAVRIERATGGAVHRKDLRPADWAAIWPELAAVQQA